MPRLNEMNDSQVGNCLSAAATRAAKLLARSVRVTTSVSDLASEVSIRLLRYRGAAIDSDAVNPLAYRICRNLLTDMNRKKVLPESTIPRDKGIDEIAIATMPPVDDDEQEYVRATIRDALQTLQPNERVALSMRIQEGATFAEIARAFGLTESTASRRIRNAMTSLRRLLATRAAHDSHLRDALSNLGLLKNSK